MAYSLCGSVGANTGQIDCDVTRGNPATIILGSAAFTSSDYATNSSFATAFKAKLKLATGDSNKLYPFPAVQGVADKTVAAKEGTLGYGLQVKLLRSKPGYELDVLAGSTLEKKLIAFDGLQIPLFIFDDHSNVWGKKDPSGNFVGAKYLVSVEPRGFGDANSPKTTKIQISIVDTKDFTENAYFANTTFQVSDLVGLLDATLSEAVAKTSNVIHVQAIIATSQIGGGINVYTSSSAVATAMAAGANWVATNVQTGGAFTITSVAQNAAGYWDVTLDTTMWSALTTGQQVKLAWASPTVLDAANVVGLESQAVIVTK